MTVFFKSSSVLKFSKLPSSCVNFTEIPPFSFINCKGVVHPMLNSVAIFPLAERTLNKKNGCSRSSSQAYAIKVRSFLTALLSLSKRFIGKKRRITRCKRIKSLLSFLELLECHLMALENRAVHRRKQESQILHILFDFG